MGGISQNSFWVLWNACAQASLQNLRPRAHLMLPQISTLTASTLLNHLRQLIAATLEIIFLSKIEFLVALSVSSNPHQIYSYNLSLRHQRPRLKHN